MFTISRRIFRLHRPIKFCSSTSSSPNYKDKNQKKDLSDLKKNPVEKLDEIEKQPFAEKQPLPEWENGVNPATGEVGGPRGVEPTRYGDWERKGRVSDF